MNDYSMHEIHPKQRKELFSPGKTLTSPSPDMQFFLKQKTFSGFILNRQCTDRNQKNLTGYRTPKGNLCSSSQSQGKLLFAYRNYWSTQRPWKHSLTYEEGQNTSLSILHTLHWTVRKNWSAEVCADNTLGQTFFLYFSIYCSDFKSHSLIYFPPEREDLQLL